MYLYTFYNTGTVDGLYLLCYNDLSDNGFIILLLTFIKSVYVRFIIYRALRSGHLFLFLWVYVLSKGHNVGKSVFLSLVILTLF